MHKRAEYAKVIGKACEIASVSRRGDFTDEEREILRELVDARKSWLVLKKYGRATFFILVAIGGFVTTTVGAWHAMKGLFRW